MQHRELTRIVFNLMNYLFIAAANFVVPRCKRVYLFSNVFEQAEMCNQKKKNLQVQSQPDFGTHLAFHFKSNHCTNAQTFIPK